MEKTFLLVCFLFLLVGSKAQQAKSKKTDIIEYKEGGNPAVKAQQVSKSKVNRAITADQKADSVRQFVMGKDTFAKKLPIKKLYRKAAKKPSEKVKAKRDD